MVPVKLVYVISLITLTVTGYHGVASLHSPNAGRLVITLLTQCQGQRGGGRGVSGGEEVEGGEEGRGGNACRAGNRPSLPPILSIRCGVECVEAGRPVTGSGSGVHVEQRSGFEGEKRGGEKPREGIKTATTHPT